MLWYICHVLLSYSTVFANLNILLFKQSVFSCNCLNVPKFHPWFPVLRYKDTKVRLFLKCHSPYYLHIPQYPASKPEANPTPPQSKV